MIYIKCCRVSSNFGLASITWTFSWSAAKSRSTAKIQIPASRQKRKIKSTKDIRPGKSNYFSMRLKAVCTDHAELTKKAWRDPGCHQGVTFTTGLQSGSPHVKPCLYVWMMSHRLCSLAPQSSDSPACSRVTLLAVTTKGHRFVFIYVSGNADTDICYCGLPIPTRLQKEL